MFLNHHTLCSEGRQSARRSFKQRIYNIRIQSPSDRNRLSLPRTELRLLIYGFIPKAANADLLQLRACSLCHLG
ncbi:MAG: hypothetical protein ACLR1R_06395 [Ruminococcus callidus]